MSRTMLSPTPQLASNFDAIPRAYKACVDGVEYVPLRMPDGAELYLTGHGWPWRANLLPAAWYDGERYLREGKKLRFSTGHVYRMMTHVPGNVPGHVPGRDLEIVIKVSRMAQEVPIVVLHDHGVAGRDPHAAEFRTPFEELAQLENLRAAGVGKDRLRTKRALAIFTPGNPYEDWQLGRASAHVRSMAQHLHARQQGNGYGQCIELYPQRDYMVLFAWIKGENAEELMDAGILDGADLAELARQTAQDMQARGFTVLDHKPNHVILRRRRRDGKLLQRHGRLVYALADFELLVPTQT